MIRIVSPDERQSYLYKEVHPFFINSVEMNATGVADFNLYEYKKPTMEFLDNIDPHLTMGLFKTTLAVYAVRDFTIQPPFDRYKFFLQSGSEYIEASEYCEANDSTMVFADECVYFIQERRKPFPLRGMMFITNDSKMISFSAVASEGSIQISTNLFLNSKIPYVTVFDSKVPYVNKTIHNSTIAGDGQIQIGDVIINEATEVSCETNFALSNTGLVLYTVDGLNHHSFIDIDYYSFNKNKGIINIELLKKKISKGREESSVEVNALYVFTNDLTDNDECCKLRASDIFPDYVEYISDSRFGLTQLIQDDNASLVPIRSTDPRLTIDYGNDKEYFGSLQALSRRVARNLLNGEYSQIRNTIPPSSVTEDGLTVHVNNRYSQTISVYINGKYHHKPFTRTDTLGLSKVVIPKDDLLVYGDIKTIEVNVEPLYTARHDLIIDGVIQYQDRTGKELTTQSYLIPTYNLFNSDKEKEVYVDGFLLDESMYSYEIYNGRGFIFIKKDFKKDIQNVTVISNAVDMYDRKHITPDELASYSILDEHCKVFYGGVIVPYEHFEDLYKGKVINVNFYEETLTGDNAKITILQIKDNPQWNMYLKDAVESPLLNGYIYRHENQISLVTVEMIFNHVKNFKTENTIIDKSYPLSYHNDSLIQRTKFLYEYMLIGKLLKWNCNEVMMNGSVEDLVAKYPTVNQDGHIVIDCNAPVLEMAIMNSTYEDYVEK